MADDLVLPADVGQRASIERAVALFIAGTGGIDVVVANAGVCHLGPLQGQRADDAEEMTRINWLGTLWTIQSVLPHLLRQRRGHVVVVSSGTGLRGFPEAAVYSATKAAQRIYADALWHELAGTGVSVTTVFPGEIATGFHDHQLHELPPWRAARPGFPAGPLADAIIRAIEQDVRYVFHPQAVRLIGALHAVSPRFTDSVLRRVRGPSTPAVGRYGRRRLVS